MRPAVIVDMDGTLADVSGIRHYVLDDPKRKNFQKFHAAASLVPPIPMVVELVQALHRQGLVVVVMTSRKEQWRYRTKLWLINHYVPYYALGMRSDGDDRRDDAVKRDLHDHMRDTYDLKPVLAIDDNPQVIALWRELGIPTVRVPGWIKKEDQQ